MPRDTPRDDAHPGRGPGSNHAPRPGAGKPERYIQPCILMALTKGPSYGYELIQTIPEYGFMRDEPAPGMVYRHLRQMEEEGLLVSDWETEGAGPARRIYRITPDGAEMLEAWVGFMARQARTLKEFVSRYRGEQPPAEG